ncbi:unnamed protein product [Symbiodinium necroappetens]|uniref:Uncharacterized protein n=1 Tax=Symbiodinium necroappetens TaxID=1628268 RepID=A0A812QL43_9DINO|nr:unnamed protein product [Symbiodinium necroappetens]
MQTSQVLPPHVPSSQPEAKYQFRLVEQEVSTTSHLEEGHEYVRQLSFFGGSDSLDPSPEPSEEGLEVQNVLGPPLEFLPKDIEPVELDAYRADYQAFRAGNATGARGEMASLCASVRERKLEFAEEKGSYKAWKKRRPRLVPLIGLDLATSSAVRSAASAADEHLEEMAQIHAISGRINPETSEDSGYEHGHLSKAQALQPPQPGQPCGVISISTPPTARGLEGQARRGSKDLKAVSGFSEMKLRVKAPDKKFSRQSSAPASAADLAVKKAWSTLRPQAGTPVPPKGGPGANPVKDVDLEAEWPEDGFVSPPWERATTSSPVIAQTGIGFFTHIAVSLLCLAPFLNVHSTTHHCLFLPSMYAAYVTGMCLKFALFPDPSSSERPVRLISKVLRTERLVREGSVPVWFPPLAAAVYVLMVLQLDMGHSFQSIAKSQRSYLSATPQRHDYNCWGTDQQDVSDCVLVRHAGCTMTVSFYTCLVFMAVCNRSVKGSDIVEKHRKCLQEIFPLEAPSLLAYVERSVNSNSTFWRSHRRYKAQSVVLSLSWTLMSFGVYTELLQGAKTRTAQVVFITALVGTYALQYTLLRHVLLRVILLLEGVKARAAAMAFCDEEGVLPFTSGHSIYVWFSVRRNVQAQNEVGYQNASPIFTSMLICAAACSCWVISELRQRGMSVFGLTSRGGVSLMVVASALVSSIFVGVFLRTLLEIGKLEDAHVRQLRIAHLRLEHAKCLKKVAFGQAGKSQCMS